MSAHSNNVVNIDALFDNEERRLRIAMQSLDVQEYANESFEHVTMQEETHEVRHGHRVRCARCNAMVKPSYIADHYCGDCHDVVAREHVARFRHHERSTTS